MLKSENLGLMVWSPLAGGLLSGKYKRDGSSTEPGRRKNFSFPPGNMDRAFDCIDAMTQMAEAKGVTVAQIALSWLLHQKVVTSVIIGAKRIGQLDDNIAATQVKLNDDELAALDEVSQFGSEYPGWMFARQGEYRLNQLRESSGG